MDFKYGPSVSITEMVKMVAKDVFYDQIVSSTIKAQFGNVFVNVAHREAERVLDKYIKSDEFERRVLEIVLGTNSTIMKTQIEKVREEIKQLISTPFPEPTRSGQPWTDGEVAQLEREVSKLVSKLAGMYGRTPKAIESKARALGLLGYKH